MITRDVAQLRVVQGFEQGLSGATTTFGAGEQASAGNFVSHSVFDASCGSLNGDSTANLVAGNIIDRLGLGRNYNAVSVLATGSADLGTSSVDAKFGALSAWLYHSSTTCADDFDRFSTDNEQARAKLFLLNTTSTLASGFMATSTAAATYGVFSATATGDARADYNAHYSLAGAGRYLRPHALVEAYASSSGGTAFNNVSVSLAFGEPDEAPRTTTSTATLYRN